MGGGRKVIAMLLIILAAATSCAGEQDERVGQAADRNDRAGGATSTVSVVLDDYTLEPDRASVPSGVVTFEVSVVPDAKRPHQFAVYQTDLPPDRLPLSVDNVHVDVLHEGLEIVEFLADATEEPQALRTELAPGKYVLVCNAEDHYLKGMWAAFRVT